MIGKFFVSFEYRHTLLSYCCLDGEEGVYEELDKVDMEVSGWWSPPLACCCSDWYVAFSLTGASLQKTPFGGIWFLHLQLSILVVYL